MYIQGNREIKRKGKVQAMTIIGVIGSDRGVGTTHTALAIANSFGKKMRVAVVEKSGRDSLYSLGLEAGEINEYEDSDYFKYKYVDYYLKDVGISVFNRNYDALVIDFGTEFTDEALRCDHVFLVMSSRPWNRATGEVFDKLGNIEDAVGLENLYGVVPFTDKHDQKYFKDEFEDMKFFFPDFEENPLEKSSVDYSFLVRDDKAVKKKFRAFESKIEDLEKAHEEQKKVLAEKEEAYSKAVEEVQRKEESIASYISEVEDYAKKVEGYTKTIEDMEKEKENAEVSHEEEMRKAEEEKKRLEERLFASTHDALTGLCNRRVFQDKLDELIKNSEPYTLVYVDLNNLKQVNDTKGHSEGDKYLKAVTKELSKEFDSIYRIGGDEFAIITDKTEFSTDKLQKVDNRLSNLTTKSDGFIYEISYGFADSTEGTCAEVVNLADHRMYENKAYKKGLREEESRKVSSVYGKTEEPEEKESVWDIPEEEDEKEPENNDLGTIEGRMKENIACYTFSPDDTIPGTFPFGDDKHNRKDLDTMHFTKINLSYEQAKYNEVTLWVFATEYVKPPFPVNIIVVWEEKDSYGFAYGKNNQVTINGADFTVNGRFTKDGSFSVGIIPLQQSVKILERNDVPNKGAYTPRHFGLLLEGMEFYPIRQNLNGVCDSIILRNGQAYLSEGVETFDGRTYELILSGEIFEALTT